MRVLMFGWEFPPHIAGGLGTACYGLTRGLARNGVEVIFVVPKAYGDEDQRFIRVVNASDVDAIYRSGDADSDIEISRVRGRLKAERVISRVKSGFDRPLIVIIAMLLLFGAVI